MKKLLALILCVMLFVAVIPTSAFATVGALPAPSGATLYPKWADKFDSKLLIKDLKDDMKDMYFGMAADQVVFGTAQTMHDLANGIAENLFEGVESAKDPITGKKVFHDDLVDNVRWQLKIIIGDEIANYMHDRQDVWTDGDGFVKPEAYLKTFATAASKAISSEKAQKSIEAFVYGIAALKLQSDMFDAADDLRDAIAEWSEGYKWGEFGEGFGIYGVKNPGMNWEPTVLIPNEATDVWGDSANSGAWSMFGYVVPSHS